MDGAYGRIDVDSIVEVWNTFTRTWTSGFAIAEIAERGVRVRRLSDGSVLPLVLDADRVRPGRSDGGARYVAPVMLAAPARIS